MDSFADRYGRLYDSARQAIAAAAVAATPPDLEVSTAGVIGQQEKRQELLEDTLDRFVEEAHNNTNDDGGRRRSAKRSRPGAAPSANNALDAAAADEGADGTCARGEAGGESAGLEGQCLGLLAEAFADDLDLLRKDEHFGGSPKSIAAMADMMR